MTRVRLDSWKAIADYLGRDVRTVIRWEKERHLPVHRVPGGRTRTVYAFSDELQQWMEHGAADTAAPAATPPAPGTPAIVTMASRTPRVNVIVLTLAVLFVTVSVWATIRIRQPVARIVLEGSSLVAQDIDGRSLWRHLVSAHSVAFDRQRFAYVGDLDDRPGDEVVAAVEWVTNRGAYGGSLFSFTGAGRVRWQIDPQGTFTFGAGPFGGPWLPLDMTVIGSGPSARIALALHHQTWWPSIVGFYDPDGAMRGVFVNAGWISSLTTSPDGAQLLAAGISNSRDAAVLAVLDARRLSGRSPEEPGSPYECRDCPAEMPLKYFVLPLPEVRRVEGTAGPLPKVRAITGGGYELRLPLGEGVGRSDEMIYEFDAAYILRRQDPSDSYWAQHDRLAREGKLDHPREKCLEPHGPRSRVFENGAWR